MESVSTKPPKRSTKLFTKPAHVWIYTLSVVLVIFAVVISVLFVALEHTNNRMDALSRAVATQGGLLASGRLNSNFQPVTASVADGTVYFPELKLKLPLNDNTLGLRYEIRGATYPNGTDAGQAVVDVTTTKLVQNDPGVPRRLACTPVRLAFEATPNPYNRHETNVASVTLADGRVLQAYAFNDDSCDQLYENGDVDSVALGKLFQDAQSY